MTTIDEIYAAINPLPGKLTAKGKVQPRVEFQVEANAKISISMNWQKFGSDREWDRDYEYFSGADFSKALAKAVEFIETNCAVLCVPCHDAKTRKIDVPIIAKAKRVRAKHLGIRKRSRFPASRDSKWKKKMDGSVVLR